MSEKNLEKVYVLVWEDDFLVASSNMEEIRELKKIFRGNFKMEKMEERGELRWRECTITVHAETDQSTYECCDENVHGSSSLKITYCRHINPILLGESDADLSGNQNTRKSNRDFYFKYGEHSGAISWQVMKQTNCCILELRSRISRTNCSKRTVISLTTIS